MKRGGGILGFLEKQAVRHHHRAGGAEIPRVTFYAQSWYFLSQCMALDAHTVNMEVSIQSS